MKKTTKTPRTVKMKTSEVIVILFQIILPSLGQQHLNQILFPVSPNIVWSPLNPEIIDCRGKAAVPPLKDGARIVGRIPILHQQYLIDGYLCTGIHLQTRCSSNFFGKNTIEYIEEHNEVTEPECSAAIRKHLDGTTEVISYPAQSCSWLSTTSMGNNYVKIEAKSLLYDPYENVGVSELFPSSKCSGTFCHTMHTGQYWIPSNNHPPSCRSDMLETVMFKVEPQGNGVVDFWSPDFHIPSGHKICNMGFCGLVGFMFHDGTWVGVEPKDLPGDDGSKSFFSKIKPCNKTTHLSVLEKEYSIHVAETTILDKFMEVECLKTKENLILGNPVSRVELQSLGPRSPGLNRVFRLTKGTLETGISYYKFVNMVAPTGNNPLIVQDSMGNPIKWHYWVEDHKQKILDGPNGLFIYNGKVSYHNRDINEYRKALSLSLKQMIPITTPQLYAKSTTVKDGNTVQYAKLDKYNADKLFDFHFPKWASLSIYIGVGLITAIIIITVLVKINPVLRKTQRNVSGSKYQNNMRVIYTP